MSETIYGSNVDEYPELHPAVLERYHGVLGDSIRRAPHQTGAEYPSDEDDELVSSGGSEHSTEPNYIGVDSDHSQTSDLQQTVTTHLRANINHQPVKVPRTQNPFISPAHEALLDAALEDLQTSGLIPVGYGVRPSEWDRGGYPITEQVRYGRRRDITVTLPQCIWLARAVVWAQGLHVMETLRYSLYEE